MASDKAGLATGASIEDDSLRRRGAEAHKGTNGSITVSKVEVDDKKKQPVNPGPSIRNERTMLTFAQLAKVSGCRWKCITPDLGRIRVLDRAYHLYSPRLLHEDVEDRTV